VQYARQGIRANAICPGPIETPLTSQILDTREKRNRRLVHIPIGRAMAGIADKGIPDFPKGPP